MMVRGLRPPRRCVARDLHGLERTKSLKVQRYSDTEDILGLVPEDQPDREQPSDGAGTVQRKSDMCHERRSTQR
jgi:hypothetical protein